MNLYKVTVDNPGFSTKNYYVIARGPSAAHEAVVAKRKEWKVDGVDDYVSIIELVASEGQYGMPRTLLITKEASDEQTQT